MFDLLAAALTFSAGAAIGLAVGHLWSDMTAAARQPDPSPVQDDIFTGRFGQLRDRGGR